MVDLIIIQHTVCHSLDTLSAVNAETHTHRVRQHCSAVYVFFHKLRKSSNDLTLADCAVITISKYVIMPLLM